MDYLDRLDTQYNTPETMHDYRPSHFKRPAWLIEAAELVDEAWRYYDFIVEHEIFASNYEYRKPQYNRVTEARERAEQAASHYSKMWERWSAEEDCHLCMVAQLARAAIAAAKPEVAG